MFVHSQLSKDSHLLSKKRTWTVRFDSRNNMAWRVRTHFFKKGILGSGSTSPGPDGELQHPICIASLDLKVVLLAPKGIDAFAPRLAPEK